MKIRIRLADYLKALDLDSVGDKVGALLDAGIAEDEVKEALPAILDLLIVLPPAAEPFDGPVLKVIVDLLWPVFRRKAKRDRIAAAAT